MTVRNWRRPLLEKTQFITPDGLVYELHDPPRRAVLNQFGWGLPPASITSSLGPYQHGTTPLSVRLPPREISMLIRRTGCSRNQYWAIRDELNNMLRLSRSNLNRPEPAHLRRYLSNGLIRQLDVMIRTGPGYSEGGDKWDEWAIHEDLTFIAHNPVIYDPTQRVVSFGSLVCDDQTELTFPTLFGDGIHMVFEDPVCSLIASQVINYPGTWEEFPTIIVNGPAVNFTILHEQTGLKISLAYAIATGESVTIDLTYGKKTIINNFGTPLLGHLTDDSNIGQFSIQPDPLVTDGINTFTVTGIDTTGDTAVELLYYDRYGAL